MVGEPALASYSVRRLLDAMDGVDWESAEENMVWDTATIALMGKTSIDYANRALLGDDGKLVLIDTATLNQLYPLDDNNQIQQQHLYHLKCSSLKYKSVDKRTGFYASWISHFNCD